MTRRRIGSKRTSRNSFVDDKTDAAISSVSELSQTVRTKVMRPIGAGPLPPPHLVRNADSDPFIYEGITWINGGDGIIDPTPGNAGPLNRRIRREFRADLGTAARIVAMRPSPMVTMSYADGPVAAMADARNLSRPENIIPIDEFSGPMQELETRVDAILGPKPTTLKEAMDNLKKLENIVNSGVANGNNFLLDLPYFAAQMQPGLRTVSPRFAGPNTPMSSYDDGIYYAVAANLIDYPEAFRDIHLTVATANNPDEPSDGSPGGSASSLPSYFKVSARSKPERGKRRAPLGQITAATGVQDMSGQNMNTTQGSAATGARLPQIITFPTYKSDGQKETTLVWNGRDAGKLGTPDDYVKDYVEEELAFWEKVLKATGEARVPLIDSTVLAVVMGYLQEMQNLQEKISQLKDMTSNTPNPNALQSVRSLEQRMSELYSESQKAAGLVTGLHEMGHVLDYVGEYRSSPDYLNAITKTSSGLNSQYEMARDLNVANALAQGLDHPMKADLAENLSRTFVKENLLKMIAIISRRKNLPQVRAMAQVVGDALLAMDPSLKGMLRNQATPAASAADVALVDRGWEQILRAEVGDIGSRVMPGTLIAPLVHSQVFRPNLVSDPAKLTAMAEQAISEIRRIGEESIVGVVGPGATEQYSFYNDYINPLIKAAEERISVFPRPAQRAIALAATAVAAHKHYLDGFNSFMAASSRDMQQLGQDEQAIAYLASWFGNNVTQDDMDKAILNSGRTIMTDLMTANPAMVREFMEIYGSHNGEPWFDGAGAFDATEYLKDVLNGPNGPKGMSMADLVIIINQWHAIQGTNGWKNLSDNEIRLIQSAAAKLTDYGGPADYDFVIPLPKFQFSTNKETYAELHPMLLMRMERLLQRLTAKERRAVERLHEEMIARARAVINRTNQGGTTP